MNSKERILEYLNIKGISKREFYINTGLSNGFLDKTNNIGADKIEIIISIYPEINLYWLITGKGTMVLDSHVHSDVHSNVHIIPNVQYSNGHDNNTTENSAIPKVHYNGVHEPQPNYVAAAITISSILEQIKILANCSTDNELAEFFGVKQVTISAWRVRNTINYELLINICAKYGWSLDILFGLKPSPVQSNQTNKDLIIAKLTGQVELLKELLAKK